MNDRQVRAAISDDQFDLDIRVKMVTKAVDRFAITVADTDSCASTCGGECTNSCASTCEGDCGGTETCATCGSCTSECDGDDTGGACVAQLFEDHYILEVSQVRTDGIARKAVGEQVIRRVERTPREG
ncbi:hypothetical protein [Kitasatospora sp. NBC_00315]|uniref:hypothetical protein n=1 Tax=Kitasatospora sp. NBC_00315 TaxID=2975963 RepID=UPI00324A9030